MSKRQKTETVQQTLVQAFARKQEAAGAVDPSTGLTTQPADWVRIKAAAFDLIQAHFEAYSTTKVAAISTHLVSATKPGGTDLRSSARKAAAREEQEHDPLAGEDDAAELQKELSAGTSGEAAALSATAAVLRREESASRFLDLVSDMASDSRLCNQLLFVLANHDTHTPASGLSLRAMTLLQALHAAHPPARLAGNVLLVNDEAPSFQAIGNGMLTFPPLQALFSKSRQYGFNCLLECVEAAEQLLQQQQREAACSPGAPGSALPAPSGASAAPSTEARPLGKALVLKFMLTTLCDDLEARLAACKRFPAAAKPTLQCALLWRLLSGDGAMSSWRGERSKTTLVHKLLLMVAAASHICSEDEEGKDDDMQVDSDQQGAAASRGPAASAPQAAQLVLSAAELGGMARRLLGAMHALYVAADEAKMYLESKESKIRQYRHNDRFELEACVMEALAFSTVLLPLKDADAKCRLLSALPPGFTLPVLCFFLAESHDRRGFKEEKYPLLASLHEYYTDRGTTIAACPPLDAVTMLKCLDEEFGWASGFLFGGFQGFVVLLTQLVITALRCRAQHPCDLGQLKQLYGELAAKIADSKNNAAAKLSPDAAVALAVTSHMVQQAAA